MTGSKDVAYLGMNMKTMGDEPQEPFAVRGGGVRVESTSCSAMDAEFNAEEKAMNDRKPKGIGTSWARARAAQKETFATFLTTIAVLGVIIGLMSIPHLGTIFGWTVVGVLGLVVALYVFAALGGILLVEWVACRWRARRAWRWVGKVQAERLRDG